MSRKQKTFSGRGPAAAAAGKQWPLTTPGDTRAFDARPKPSQTTRRDEAPYFPIDHRQSDLLGQDQVETVEDDE